MKFPYKKIALKILRPVIPISVSYAGGDPIKYFALIDSGADKCYFAAELASLLGIKNFRLGRREPVSGINGESNAYFHTVTVSIGGWPYKMEIGFMEESTLTMQGYGILQPGCKTARLTWYTISHYVLTAHSYGRAEI